MLINKDEIAKKVLSGEISDSSSLNAVLRIMIKEMVETAMKTELDGFLGYDKNRSPENDKGNRRNGYTQKKVSSKFGPISLEVPRYRYAEFSPQVVKNAKSTSMALKS